MFPAETWVCGLVYFSGSCIPFQNPFPADNFRKYRIKVIPSYTHIKTFNVRKTSKKLLEGSATCYIAYIPLRIFKDNLLNKLLFFMQHCMTTNIIRFYFTSISFETLKYCQHYCDFSYIHIHILS